MGTVESWPALPLEGWSDSCATLHRWLQIVGKIRLALAPWVNHSWHVTLYMTARGLTTAPIPHGSRSFSIDLDLIDHQLSIRVSDGSERLLPLRPVSVAEFNAELFGHLAGLALPVTIHGRPSEIEPDTPFAEDHSHRSYDPEAVVRFHRVLVQCERLLQRFRAGFIGKCSPVHLFWGSFDLAVTRFSGRSAPSHPGGIPHLPDRVVREAYSHEVSSCGFWPGGGPHPFPLFYSYAYPEPPGFRSAQVGPDGAFYSEALREFVLPYEAVRAAPSPDAALLRFLNETYAAAADGGRWEREALEWNGPPWR